jgi:hypothetical protein
MVQHSGNGARIAKVLIACACGLVSAFFVFYTARLLVVTHGLQTLRAGGRGAYAGAVVFPILAAAFGCSAWRIVRRPKTA